MSPKKKSEYAVPKLKDFSAATVDRAVDKLLASLDSEAAAVTSQSDWKVFRDRWMARKNGLMAAANDLWLKAAPAEDKGYVGKRVNWLKAHVQGRVEEVQKHILFQEAPAEIVEGAAVTVSEADFQAYSKDFSAALAARRVQAESVDVTLPGIRRPLGAEHPVIKTMNEIVGVFRNLGYSVEEGPEIETDYYNFEALNFPPNHPARDTQDTLFIANQESKPLRERLLLRTHTSPVQIRTMEKMKPPVRVVCPGKVHRNDAPDATHSPIFHQVEGLAVDTNITFCDLKGTLDHAMKALFGSSVKTRFYPSFFPFTEPSADVQISCIFCGGRGYRDGGPCRNCKTSGWIELLGCGMVDPNVYGFVDYDAKKVSGFAFGMGVERIAILKYGVDDIQLFFNGDVRFLEQFG
jgi:phenylalanyl-tRNA synthetase alpha chain